MSVRATDDDGNPLIRDPEQQSVGTQIGASDPYQTNTSVYSTALSGGGGGAPVNPAYVPPSYANNGGIKINLLADQATSFLENNHSVGIGKSIVLHRNYHAFGHQKIFKASIKGKQARNYFVVQIEKTHKTAGNYVGSTTSNSVTKSPFDFSFNSNVFLNAARIPTQNDIQHAENIVIKEYELDINHNRTNIGGRLSGNRNVNYKLKGERRINATSGVVDLRFIFADKKLDLGLDNEPTQPEKLEYEINFSSNLERELGDKVNLEYKIVTTSGQSLKEGSIKLSDNNNDLETIESAFAKDAEVHFKVTGNIGDDYVVKFLRYATNSPNKTNIKPHHTKILDPEFTKLIQDSSDLTGARIGSGLSGDSSIIINDDGLSLIYGLKIHKDPTSVRNTLDNNNKKPPIKPTDKSTENWKEVGLEFTAKASELLSHIHVHIEFEKIIRYPKPELSLGGTQFEKGVKDSDIDAIFNLMFGATNADVVNVYLTTNTVIKVDPAKGFVELSFKKHFNGLYGTKRIIIVPESKEYGTGDRYDVSLNFVPVNDFPSVTEIIHPQTIDIPSFSDGNIEWDVEYETFAATSVDVDLVLKDKTKVSLYKNLTPKGSFKINIRDLAVKFSGWNGNDNVTLIFKPYNRGGAVELTGNDYEIKTQIVYPSVKLDENIIRKSIFDAFIEKVGFTEPEKESKYLTHLVNLGNDEHVLISSWENDNWTLSEKGTDEFENEIVTKEVKSVILKLYTPLPENIEVNQTLWISKLMTNPLVETIVLNDQAEIECPPIKGPNFDIEVDYVIGRGTDYESLDNLILSSSSSNELIQSYLYKSDIDTSDLNIEYVNGLIVSGTAQFQWPNFVHFSSATERIDNFVYKVQLIENYDKLIISASTGTQTASLAGQQEIERQKAKKASLIQGFDGFDTFLYTSSSMWSSTGSESMTWPYSGSVRLPSTDSKVLGWYDRVSGLAKAYDVQNPNWLINNIPQYIRVNEENENFLLFFSMIGHHFDNIYYYTKAIERSRGLGYKSEAGLSDKLLYDWLKGFSWDALPLGSDSKLWNFLLGGDENGNTKQSTSAKKRTNEVWRRIINNLPYLLKHKGTRKGIYALMACYGVPSCNLSVMEFGGPEATDEFKNKVLMDNCSYALNFPAGSRISFTTPSTAKAIEIFFKPAYAQNKTVLYAGSALLTISGSAGSEYGKITYGSLTTSLLPIFNGRYLGVCASNNGSNVELTVMQTEGDRIIFSETITGSATIPANTTLYVGYTTNGFSGSVDEVRVWNTHLSSSIFRDHVFYPEMINGNHISASTTDLDIRFDFEYPKNIASKTKVLNIAPQIIIPKDSTRNYYEENPGTYTGLSRLRSGVTYDATAAGFSTITDWPYQFEPIDRNSLIEIPDIGVSRYSNNKVRFEEQYLVSHLSPRHRATKKVIQTGPVDSNRVGLFFSPTKELNFDIAKSMGAASLNEYIGDPADRYKPTYKKLNDLRNYYFTRIKNRNIYEYIDLVRMYEKAMFDDLKKMLPARVKATTGLLIEPHFLERSKYEYEKPTGSNNYYEVTAPPTVFPIAENEQFEGITNYDMELIGDNRYYEGPVDATFTELISEPEFCEGEIDTEKEFGVETNYYYYDSRIDAKLEQPTIFALADVSGESKLVQSNPYIDIGFGLYVSGGYGIRTYRDQYGDLKKKRVLANIVVEKVPFTFDKYTVVVNGKGDPRGGFTPTSSYYYEKKLVVQEWSGSVAPTPPSASTNIVSITKVNGYLPTHNRNTSDLTTGLLNSYYKGCKNTSATTLDGSPPVEAFITNPATIKVKPGGTDASEPIIQVE